MQFVEAIITVPKKSLDFSSRSPRSEYWWWTLFAFLLGLGLGIISKVLGLSEGAAGMLSLILNLALLLPGLSVSVRRLHDVNKSGWWLLIALTIIGIIPLIYWCVIKGTAGDNRFGPSPV